MEKDPLESHKRLLRKELAGRRNGLTEEQRRERSAEASLHAFSLVADSGASSVMLYVPFRSELSLKPLAEPCWERGIKVIAPRCNPVDRSMTLFELENWGQLAPGAYGIEEPNPDLAQRLDGPILPDIIFVPGLGFDLAGGRIGYGGGYYDTFAASLGLGQHAGNAPLWIGAGFDEQVMEAVPMESHDLTLNGLVTPSGLRRFLRTAE
ncbi:5-formyltetrahydrofolate cyclo-ligase [Paenibacillus sp. CAU 1782]